LVGSTDAALRHVKNYDASTGAMSEDLVLIQRSAKRPILQPMAAVKAAELSARTAELSAMRAVWTGMKTAPDQTRCGDRAQDAQQKRPAAAKAAEQGDNPEPWRWGSDLLPTTQH